MSKFTKYINAKLLRCFVKFAPHLWYKMIHSNRSSSNFIYKLLLHYLIRLSSKFEWISSFPFDFIRGQSLTSHDPHTRRLWAVATVLDVLLLYISKRKCTIPSILQPHIFLILLYDVRVFFIKNFKFFWEIEKKDY